jgi:hypothetical protein
MRAKMLRNKMAAMRWVRQPVLFSGWPRIWAVILRATNVRARSSRYFEMPGLSAGAGVASCVSGSDLRKEMLPDITRLATTDKTKAADRTIERKRAAKYKVSRHKQDPASDPLSVATVIRAPVPSVATAIKAPATAMIQVSNASAL